ncbi:MAG: hypothetical protein WD757_02745 [Actinomycetota bacterium]
MGTVIDLESRRRRQDPAVDRLSRAIEVLEPLVDGAEGKRSRHPGSIETELLAITGAIAGERLDEAATRAEQLAARLRRLAKNA